MSQQNRQGSTGLRFRFPLRGRDPSAEHRAATPLELFFDLVVVVAVAFSAESLHEGLVRGEVLESIGRYAIAFFGLWWAWVNFTWFASAYDSDDVVYRLFVFVTMTGALLLAAGIPRFFDDLDRTLTVLGYVVMRLALVTQWIRVAGADSPRRTTAYRYAAGISMCQLVWVASLFEPALWVPALFLVGPGELLVPMWAESASPTSWHPGHIVERYGLFMIIVLGESVLAASLAIQSATEGTGVSGDLLQIIVGGLLVIYSLWWIHFDRPGESLLSTTRTALIWGYIHFFIFASVAAVGAGLAVAIDATAGHSELGPVVTGAAIAVPIAIFLLSGWALYIRVQDPCLIGWECRSSRCWCWRLLTGAPVLVIGLLLVAFEVIKAVDGLRKGRGLYESRGG